MSKTTFSLQEHDSSNFYIGRCTTKTLGNRVSQIRMGNVRDLHLASSGELTDKQHELLKREMQPFAEMRGWYRISQTHSTIINVLMQLDKFNDVNSTSEKIIRVARRQQGQKYSSVLVDLTDILGISRELIAHHVNVMVKLGMLITEPHIEVK